ncbi:MAG: BaiN/RdsA family NAD(P)/FAD-dependent oxidoreductase [Fimbriimonadaceae bacterium]
MMDADVIVVGAGAAGIIAAWRAASLGADTLLLEKTARLGTKILISGGGKCNITHDGPIEDVLGAFPVHEARFIRPACYRFTNRQVVELFTSKGLEVYTRPNGRIFPVRQTAKEVVAILADHLRNAGVRTRVRSPVSGLIAEDGRVVGVRCNNTELRARAVVVSSGGSSYPGTGTTGDGWPWARELGHTIVKVRAALAPIHVVTDDAWASRAGVSLRDCVLKARQAHLEIARWRDDLLFTHRGVSGPTALAISRAVAERSGQGVIDLEVDLLPDLNFESLTQRIRAWSDQNPRKQWAAFLEETVPERLVPWFLETARVDRTMAAGATDKKAKNRIVAGLKGWNLGPVRDVPIEKGEVVAGGVALDEVDPHTMRSLKAQGLYLCGEILDIAGPVGGYNLQAAFSTGFVAGEAAAGRRIGGGGHSRSRNPPGGR